VTGGPQGLILQQALLEPEENAGRDRNRKIAETYPFAILPAFRAGFEIAGLRAGRFWLASAGELTSPRCLGCTRDGCVVFRQAQTRERAEPRSPESEGEVYGVRKTCQEEITRCLGAGAEGVYWWW
jgi:hypothetical protein